MSEKKTKTEGATKAGSGKYCFPMKSLDVVPAGTGYSTSKGGVVEGERMLVGYINKAKGTGSRPHSHPNEQFNYILQGSLDVEIDASFNKAYPIIKQKVPAEYHEACRSILLAAALTYVIGVFRSFFSLRFIRLLITRMR